MDITSLVRAVSLRVYVAFVLLFVFFAVPTAFAQSVSGSPRMNWTEQLGSPGGGAWGWKAIASSADGTKLIAAIDMGSTYDGNIFKSSDSGASWNQLGAGSHRWWTVSSSADGNSLAAAVFGGDIFTSSDGGETWTDQSSAGYRDWYSLASSADGTKLVAGSDSSDIFTSADSGATWSEHAVGPGRHYWYSVASSADGTKLVAAAQISENSDGFAVGGDIYTSSDSGATWTDQVNAGLRSWTSVASSADGTKLAATVMGGNIFTSSDSGATWVEHSVGTGVHDWTSVTMSSEGSKLAVADGLAEVNGEGMSSGEIYTSSDSGATWVAQTGTGSRAWSGIASSADGTKLAATDANGYVWTAVNSIPVTNIAVAASSSTATIVSGQTLQMNATVLPANATNSTVTWSVENETGTATISPLGVLTAGNAGTVIVKATANDGSAVIGSEEITVLNACAATNTCVSNVMFLPGIEASRLYRPDYNGGTDELWEPGIRTDSNDLDMTQDGI
ncbi:MAG: Ig-like domain-containing protein [Minisyncoccia bacterium]